MKVTATKTTNPLHFEDLEPHRFEDLVRQLIYDYRKWLRLEATGRLGGDDGIDIRAIESLEPDENVDEQEEEGAVAIERVWTIQCKRERTIGPSGITKIIEAAVPGGSDVPYGFILAAACDFSKKSRDTFHDTANKRGISQSIIWGKAELEDMLFLPKNDHLLFAYFNISFKVRQRSLKSALRSRLSTKRSLLKVLGKNDAITHTPVLLRDPSDENYPYSEDSEGKKRKVKWVYFKLLAHNPPDHLMFLVSEYFAYVNDERDKWDAMFQRKLPKQLPVLAVKKQKEYPIDDDTYARCISFYHQNVPQNNKATFQNIRLVHYDRILAIDADGDCRNPGPHLFIDFDEMNGPFEPRRIRFVEHGFYPFKQRLVPSSENRIDYFPKELPPPTEVQPLDTFLKKKVTEGS